MDPIDPMDWMDRTVVAEPRSMESMESMESILRRTYAPQAQIGYDVPAMSERRVLFVCLGNICRSPAGEGVFKAAARERGLDGEVAAESAGTSAYHVGEPPDRRMRQAASQRGYDLAGRARQFSEADFDRFDLIVAMDQSNLRSVRNMDRQGRYQDKIKLFSEFLGEGAPRDVPDPYYGGPDGFEKVLDLLEEGTGRILDHLAEQER